MTYKKQNTGPFFIALIFLIVQFTIACTKENDSPTIETGITTDIDGNVYQTVKIGNKW